MSGDNSDLMASGSIVDGIGFQAEHCRRNDAPVTARIINAQLALIRVEGLSCAERIRKWPGNALEDAMPLRLASALHHLKLTGDENRLDPIYHGRIERQEDVDAIVIDVVRTHDHRLFPWFDSPPQTNEAARSASLMAGLKWLSSRTGPRFELNELGASAGANMMMDRYRYDFAGTTEGPEDSPVVIRPDWQGAPPPADPVEIVTLHGCDRAPIDLTDDEAALRLKSYIWAENRHRMARMDAVIALAKQQPPQIDKADAADWAEQRLDKPQEQGVTRVIQHSIVWQYLPDSTRARVSSAIEAAGAKASAERPLAWMMLETNRQTFRHELTVRYWNGGSEDGKTHLLGQAHAHGAWIIWEL